MSVRNLGKLMKPGLKKVFIDEFKSGLSVYPGLWDSDAPLVKVYKKRGRKPLPLCRLKKSSLLKIINKLNKEIDALTGDC